MGLRRGTFASTATGAPPCPAPPALLVSPGGDPPGSSSTGQTLPLVPQAGDGGSSPSPWGLEVGQELLVLPVSLCSGRAGEPKS